MKRPHFAVIMSGGRGERFWPLGRADRPKQFLKLFGGMSLLESAAKRLLGVFEAENILVVTNATYADATRKILDFLPPENVVGEPLARDTAPALALGSSIAAARGGEESVMFAFPADHVIGDEPAFRELLKKMISRLDREPEGLYTIGITPAFPATGYGYIERGEAAGDGFYHVRSFREKPSPDLAESFLESGGFFWNGGIFAWSCGFFRDELRRYAPELAEMSEKLVGDLRSGAGLSRLEEYYSRVKKISVDYAVMEKSGQVFTVEGDFGWDDAGSFPSLRNHVPADAQGNVVAGGGPFRGFGVKDSVIVNADGGHLVAGIGLNGMLIVHTPDATLVAPESEAQKIKELLKLFEGKEKDFL